MKNKKVPLIALGLALIFPVLFVSAETMSADISNKIEVRNGVKTLVETRKAEMKDTREQNKEETKNVRSEFRKDIAKMRVDQTVRIYTATANRLDIIVTRIESRISKIVTAGGDATVIKVSLDEAKAKLVEARSNITAFAAIDVSSATATATPKELFEIVKTEALKTKETLRSAHASLVKTITLIQGIEKSVKVAE